jgi:hypothetical protein
MLVFNGCVSFRTGLGIGAGIAVAFVVIGFVGLRCASGTAGRDALPIGGLAAKESAKRSRVQTARLIALAGVMCAANEDDVFPGPLNYKAKLVRYLKSTYHPDLERFTWTFPGGVVTKDQASTTELGRIKSPDGDAVAYADGGAVVQEP